LKNILKSESKFVELYMIIRLDLNANVLPKHLQSFSSYSICIYNLLYCSPKVFMKLISHLLSLSLHHFETTLVLIHTPLFPFTQITDPSVRTQESLANSSQYAFLSCSCTVPIQSPVQMDVFLIRPIYLGCIER